jgi:hypothetical protein
MTGLTLLTVTSVCGADMSTELLYSGRNGALRDAPDGLHHEGGVEGHNAISANPTRRWKRTACEIG